jgi:hypothetical protein
VYFLKPAAPKPRPQSAAGGDVGDIEDLGDGGVADVDKENSVPFAQTLEKTKRQRLAPIGYTISQMGLLSQKKPGDKSAPAAVPADVHWKEVLGSPPKMGTTKVIQ